jgi:glycosyltransferase involved in cell wall biosynthesis
MKDQPLVSAIAIFLNEERFLTEAIESIIAQTYSNWELLLVDDGSTDGSMAIARQYAALYPDKIRYLEHENHQNLGMSASRNLGLTHARGKYISPLDGDDVWMPKKLEQQVAIAEAHPEAAMVFAPLLIWYSWTGKPEDGDLDHPYGVAKDGGYHPFTDTLVPPPKMLAFFLRREEFIPGGVLAKREIIQQIGGGEDNFRGSYEDAIVHVKVCLRHPVYVSNECWYKYRIHPDSCQRVVIKAGQAKAKRLLYLEWVERYLQQQGVTDPEVWQSLRHSLFPFRHPKLHQLNNNYQQAISQTKQLIKQGGKLLLPKQIRDRLRADSLHS